MKKVLLAAVLAFVAVVANSNQGFAKVDYEVLHDGPGVVKSGELYKIFGFSENSCYGEELIDLTEYRGQSHYILDENNKFTFVNGELECVRMPQNQIVDGFLRTIFLNIDDNGIFNEHYRYKGLKFQSLEFGSTTDLTNGDQSQTYRLFTAPNDVLGWHIRDFDMQGDQHIVTDKFGKWTLKNKAEWIFYVECEPTAPDYDTACIEITYKNSIDGQSLNEGGDVEHTIKKGKILREIATISRDVIIRQPQDYGKGGVGDVVPAPESPAPEAPEIIRSVEFLAPNTGFFDENDNYGLIFFLSVTSLTALVGLERRFL